MTIRCLSHKRVAHILGAFALSLALLAGNVHISQSQSGSPPSIVKIEFPTDVSGKAQGKVQFTDPDGDLAKARFGIVDGGILGGHFVVEPDVAGVTEGNFTFDVRCNIIPVRVAIKLILFDKAGNRSAPALFTFNCLVVPATNYDEEQATVRPISTNVTLNFFVFEDNATELAEGAMFADPTAALGEPQADVRRVFQEAVLPDLTGIWDQCGIGFDLGVVKVVRPQNVSLPSGGTLNSIFGEGEQGKVLIRDDRTLPRLDEAVAVFREVLQAQGQTITKDDRNLFIVGNVFGLAGWAQVPGRVAVILWNAIWVDPISSEIFKPTDHIRVTAHELGHDFGLPHVSQTLMDTRGVTGSGVNLTTQQCSTVQQNLSLPPF